MEERAQLALENILRHLSQGEIPAAADTLEDLHPADGADVLMELGTRQQEQILSVTSAQAVARILEHLSDADTVQVSHRIQANILPQVLDNMEADKAADLLNELPPDQASSILSRMVGAANVASLLLHPEDSAGGIMSLQFVVFEEDITTQQAIDYLRRVRPSSERVYYLFVRDPGNHLTGVLSLRQLVIASPGEKVRDIMNTEVISVPAGTDREACARLMEHYNLSALPVVDEERRLVGVITLEEVVDVIEEEATEDMYRMVGLTEEEQVDSPLLFSVRKRLPWLYVNLATLLVAATVVNMFEDTVAQVAVLAAFMPVVAGLGGNVGIQSLTVIVRGLALGETSPREVWKLLTKGAALGLIHGVAIGFAAGLIVLLWKGNLWLGIIIALSMMGNMVVAGAAGVLIPIGLRAMRVDPALASGIFLTTLTDICGFLFFLGLSSLLISKLL